MAGTWFGGGDAAKYLAVITPGASNDFNLVFDGAYSLTTLGFPVKTIWSGSIVRTNTTFDLYAIGMTNASTGFPAPTPDVWAVHAKVRLTDCNTLHIDYDFFGAYYWSSNKTPFVDLPDYVVAPPPFSETYKRMPTTCQQCGRL
jgi:hypothetical protein